MNTNDADVMRDYFAWQMHPYLCATTRLTSGEPQQSLHTSAEKLPPLDLMDLPTLDPLRERVRECIGDAISERAVNAESAGELLEGLRRDLPGGFPRFIARGSTREVWELPLNLVLKIELPDPDVSPLPPAELEHRGGWSYVGHLWHRRRRSNFAETSTGTCFPSLVVPLYGVRTELRSVPHKPRHPRR